MSVVVVTDSTAYLPPELTEGYGIHVVPLYVILPGRSGREGLDVGPEDVARALAVRGQTVSTSRPTPGDFLTAYRQALDAGAERESTTVTMCSPTCEAANRAASDVPESSAERWIETSRSAPASSACR